MYPSNNLFNLLLRKESKVCFRISRFDINISQYLDVLPNPQTRIPKASSSGASHATKQKVRIDSCIKSAKQPLILMIYFYADAFNDAIANRNSINHLVSDNEFRIGKMTDGEKRSRFCSRFLFRKSDCFVSMTSDFQVEVRKLR